MNLQVCKFINPGRLLHLPWIFLDLLAFTCICLYLLVVAGILLYLLCKVCLNIIIFYIVFEELPSSNKPANWKFINPVRLLHLAWTCLHLHLLTFACFCLNLFAFAFLAFDCIRLPLFTCICLHFLVFALQTVSEQYCLSCLWRAAWD